MANFYLANKIKRLMMAKKLDPSEELTSWEDIAYSNMVQNEAVLRLLVKKGIVKKRIYRRI